MQAKYKGKTILSTPKGFRILDTIAEIYYPKTVDGLAKLTGDIDRTHPNGGK